METVSLLLSHRAISPNGVHPPGSGTTPLHLAASLGRAEIVNLLLDQEGIDDTLRDKDGKTCKDVARGREVLRIIEGAVLSWLSFSIRDYWISYHGIPGSWLYCRHDCDAYISTPPPFILLSQKTDPIPNSRLSLLPKRVLSLPPPDVHPLFRTTLLHRFWL